MLTKLGIDIYYGVVDLKTKEKRIMIHYPLTDNLRSYAWKQVSIKNFGNRSQGFNGTKEKQYTGILGECVVHDLLKRELPTYDQGSVIADLVINNKKVDVKSMARNVDMQDYYVHNFVGYQKDTDCDVLLFISINKKTGVAQVCGWLPKQTFLEQANFFDKGSKRTRADGTSFITMAPLYEIENNKLNKITSIEDLRKL
jgi:hypothetical protein